MDVKILGALEARVDGRTLSVGGGKARALLALLALHAGSTVSTDRLVDGLWGEQPPASAVKLVQLYVSQLRKLLAQSGADAEIVTHGRGYELRLGDGGVDARRFEELLEGGAAREALALWRGPALADVADEPFAAPEIRRLEELRVAAVELAIDGDLAAGRHREVAGELEAMVAEHPLRERLHWQRMLALYRSGRQAEALEAYRHARAMLVEQIGVEPGPELRRLHEAILRHDAALEPPVAELPPELAAGTPLVGREADLDRLREHWRRAHGGAGRLVLVGGARGMGKTRLAAELAAEVHRDGAAVLYGSGAGSAAPAHEALAAARTARRPTLVVLDDLDRADDDLRAALDELVDGLAALPVLVLVTAADADPLAALHVDATLTLASLDADGVRAVTRLYSGELDDDEELPVERLVTASGGVPQAVHRAASEWARTLAARRLGDAAGRLAAERAGLRAAEDDVAGNIVELQAARERAELGERAAAGVVVCPFKGLAAFEPEDAEFFFGRERLVAEMAARLTGAPLMGIVGPSGSGKSSALRAGLLPALAEGVLPGSDGWALALLRSGEHPLRALQDATAEAPPRGRLVIAVDQFEEVFTTCRDEAERSAFVDALVASARDPRRRALVLVAVRADFYGRCSAYPELSRLLGANHVLVGPMRRDELRRAIELPARRAGLRAEPALADALIADVEGEPGALPLLSTALLELWQRRDGRRLTLAAYEQAGGVHGAVARLAERAYARLDPEQQRIARAILLRLAGEGEGEAVVRARVPLTDFGPEAEPVLGVLADDRLVTVGEGEVEVAHEALLREWPRLRAWLEEDAQGRRLHHHLVHAAREWDAGGRDPGELYRGARLASALDWATEHEPELSATERAFIDEGRAASGRSTRRLRAVLAGVAALLVLAVAAGLVALDQRGNARDEATAAEAQRVGSRALVEDNLDRALLLARQGVALDDSVQTHGNLLAALIKSPAAIGVIRGDADRILQVALSPDGRTLAVGNNAGKVFLFDTRSRRRVATLEPTPHNDPIAALGWSPDGRRLAVGHAGPTGDMVAVVGAHDGHLLARMQPPREHLVFDVRFSRDGATLGVVTFQDLPPEPGPAVYTRFDTRSGSRLRGPVRITRRGPSPLMLTGDERSLVAAGVGEVTVRDASSLRVMRRFPLRGVPPNASALSPDDRTLALGGQDGSVRLLDLRTGRIRVASGRHDAPVLDARFTPDGRNLITAGDDRDAIVWDVGRAVAAETLSGHAGRVLTLDMTRDGATLFTGSLDGTVFVWDLVGARRLGRPFKAGTGDFDRPYLALSSDGRLIAMGQDDGAISVVDARTLARHKPFPVVDTGQVQGIGYVPSRHVMVVGGPEGFLALVDTDRGRVLRRLRGHRSHVFTPGISADGRLLVTGGGDRTVRFWSLPSGRPLGAPLRFDDDLTDTQLSPDGRWVTVVLFAPTNPQADRLEVWDARTRRRVRTIRPRDGVTFTRFSPDGRLVALGDNRGQAQVWSTADRRPVTRLFGGHAGPITAAAISPDGRTLATGSTDGTVRLWDIPGEQAIGAPLPGLPNRPVVPFFSPDGTRLFAAYDSGRVFRWDIRPASLVRQACRVAGRRLTRAEWQEFLPGRAYDPAC